MKLVLIRHGKTEASEQHLYCGSTDIPLSQTGRAELEAQKYSGLYPSSDGFAIYTSGMLRADETLRLIYGDINREILPELREMDFGVFEMQSYEQLRERDDYIEWISGDNEKNRCPGGESGDDMTRRVLDCLKLIIKDDRDALIVSHGGPISAIMAFLFPDEGKNRYQWQPKPGGAYILNIKTGNLTYFAL